MVNKTKIKNMSHFYQIHGQMYYATSDVTGFITQLKSLMIRFIMTSVSVFRFWLSMARYFII